MGFVFELGNGDLAGVFELVFVGGGASTRGVGLFGEDGLDDAEPHDRLSADNAVYLRDPIIGERLRCRHGDGEMFVPGEGVRLKMGLVAADAFPISAAVTAQPSEKVDVFVLYLSFTSPARYHLANFFESP